MMTSNESPPHKGDGGQNRANRKGLLNGVKPENVASSGINIFDPRLSVEDLWGDETPLSGSALLDHVLMYYGDGEMDVPFFQVVNSDDSKGAHGSGSSEGITSNHGVRSVVKSPLSRELQESTVECYKQRIFAESISQLAAGQDWFQLISIEKN